MLICLLNLSYAYLLGKNTLFNIFNKVSDASPSFESLFKYFSYGFMTTM